MTQCPTRRPRRVSVLLLALVIAGACSSSGEVVLPSDDETTSPAPATTATPEPDPSPTPTSAADATPETSATTDPTPAPTTPAEATTAPTATPVPEVILPTPLVEEFTGPEWDPDVWTIDTPGESLTTVTDGVGVMLIDTGDTHEWVRAYAPETTHSDASVKVTVTPQETSLGTAFIALRGDGEWRDNTPYLPQSGVAIEYAYAPTFEGEVTFLLLDGPDVVRSAPILAPVLRGGEGANVRLEVEGGIARARVWRVGTDEPVEWTIQAEVDPEGLGVVQLSYRDEPAQALRWDDLTLSAPTT